MALLPLTLTVTWSRAQHTMVDSSPLLCPSCGANLAAAVEADRETGPVAGVAESHDPTELANFFAVPDKDAEWYGEKNLAEGADAACAFLEYFFEYDVEPGQVRPPFEPSVDESGVARAHATVRYEHDVGHVSRDLRYVRVLEDPDRWCLMATRSPAHDPTPSDFAAARAFLFTLLEDAKRVVEDERVKRGHVEPLQRLLHNAACLVTSETEFAPHLCYATENEGENAIVFVQPGWRADEDFLTVLCRARGGSHAARAGGAATVAGAGAGAATVTLPQFTFLGNSHLGTTKWHPKVALTAT